MRDFMIIKDPQVAKLFADPTRRSILHNLRHKEMSPRQLAKVLEKNVSSVSYHLDALEKAGLVEKSRTEIKRNLVMRFYRASARIFVISYTLSEGLVPGSENIAKWSKEVCRRAVSSLDDFGYELPSQRVDKLTKYIEKYTALQKKAYEEVISQQTSPTNLEHPSLRLLVDLLTHVNLYGNPEYVEVLEGISREIKETRKIAVRR